MLTYGLFPRWGLGDNAVSISMRGGVMSGLSGDEGKSQDLYGIVRFVVVAVRRR